METNHVNKNPKVDTRNEMHQNWKLVSSKIGLTLRPTMEEDEKIELMGIIKTKLALTC